LVASLLAFGAALALYKQQSFAIPLVWIFNIWGTLDFLLAYYEGVFGVQLDAGALGSAFYIPTVIVPAGLITHGLIFRFLLRPNDV